MEIRRVLWGGLVHICSLNTNLGWMARDGGQDGLDERTAHTGQAQRSKWSILRRC